MAGPTAPEHVGPRRDSASAQRQLEKCTAGALTAEAPIRHGRAVRPSAQLIERRRSDYPSRSGHRQAIAEVHFSARPAEAPWADVLGAVGPANHRLGSWRLGVDSGRKDQTWQLRLLTVLTTRYEVIGSGPALLMFSPGGFDATLDKWTTQSVYARIKLLEHLPKKLHLHRF